jgi:uncharacterized repeat protein (TIGR03809 family)
MSDKPPAPSPQAVLSLDPIARKWRNLVDRRRAHFVDLYLTGRWKRYYSEEQFLTIFRDAMTVAERWTEIAPQPGDAKKPADAPKI